jgi:hypothetical protein
MGLRPVALRLIAPLPVLLLGWPGAAWAQDAAGQIKPLGDPKDQPKDPQALETLLDELRADRDPADKQATDQKARENLERRLPEPLGALPPDRSGGWRWAGEVNGQQYTKAGLDGISGRLDTRRLGFGVNATKAEGPGRLWRVDYGYEFSTYSFRDAGAVVPGSTDPVESLFRNELGVSRINLPRDEWGYFARFGVASGMEKDTEIGDSLVYSLIGALSIPANPSLAWNLGALVQTELNGELLIVPVIGVDWRIDPRTRLRTVGPGLELTRELSAETRVFTRAMFRARDHRLDDVGPLPGGIFEDRELLVSLGLDWNPGLDVGWLSSSNARLFAGFTPWRRLEFFDAQDQEVERLGAEAGLVLGLNVQLAW